MKTMRWRNKNKKPTKDNILQLFVTPQSTIIYIVLEAILEINYELENELKKRIQIKIT